MKTKRHHSGSKRLDLYSLERSCPNCQLSDLLPSEQLFTGSRAMLAGCSVSFTAIEKKATIRVEKISLVPK